MAVHYQDDLPVLLDDELLEETTDRAGVVRTPAAAAAACAEGAGGLRGGGGEVDCAGFVAFGAEGGDEVAVESRGRAWGGDEEDCGAGGWWADGEVSAVEIAVK